MVPVVMARVLCGPLRHLVTVRCGRCLPGLRQDEFALPYMKMFPSTSVSDFECLWKKIDKNGTGLS